MLVQKLIQLENYPDILVSSRILNYDKPDFIYIPIEEDSTILVRKNDPVLIGSPVLKKKNGNVFSTVSGIVTDLKDIYTYNGIKKAVEISNDFQDKSITFITGKKNISKMAKNVLDSIMSSNFKIDLNQKKGIILNCIDDEPCTVTENFYLFLNSDMFLDILDKLYKIYHLEKIILAVKSLSSENISKLMNHLGMYPNITLNIVPNLYLLGHPQFLLSYLNLNQNDCEVIKASEFYGICELLGSNRISVAKYITITGDGIKSPCVIKARIGSKLKEIIKNMEMDDKVIFIANGLMQGKIIPIDDFIIEPDLTSIFIMKEQKIQASEECIHCGACIDICPVKLNPTLFLKPKYLELVKDKCLQCGLCSYICPAHINFKERREESYE